MKITIAHFCWIILMVTSSMFVVSCVERANKKLEEFPNTTSMFEEIERRSFIKEARERAPDAPSLRDKNGFLIIIREPQPPVKVRHANFMDYDETMGR